jgi:hypothetical protein
MSDLESNDFLSEMLKAVSEPTKASTPTADNNEAPTLTDNDELIEMGEDFSFDDYQVVRREFFAHLSEPSISFNKMKFHVSTAALSKFPNTDYAQVLVNQSTKILALRPCSEGERDSFQWCNVTKSGKRKPRDITCKLFFAKIVSLMNWVPKYRYKILGKLIHANGEYLLVFDLTATEVYECTLTEDNKEKTSRTPVFPSEWKDQFGMPFNEHRQSMQINIFDGYAIYAVKENAVEAAEAATAIKNTQETAQ